MSSKYIPDRWVLLEINNNGEKIQKVLAGWNSGYTDSDYWRICSGVKNIEIDGDYYLFHNYSGSVYKCHKKGQGLTRLTGSIFEMFKKDISKLKGVTLELIKMDED